LGAASNKPSPLRTRKNACKSGACPNFLSERVAASVAAALSSGQDPGVEALNLPFKKYRLKQIA
jgi:hypothetical protein